jgi:hypothetical protein
MNGAGTLNTGRHSGAGGISPGARSSLVQAGAEYKGGEYGATVLLVGKTVQVGQGLIEAASSSAAASSSWQ